MVIVFEKQLSDGGSELQTLGMQQRLGVPHQRSRRPFLGEMNEALGIEIVAELVEEDAEAAQQCASHRVGIVPPDFVEELQGLIENLRPTVVNELKSRNRADDLLAGRIDAEAMSAHDAVDRDLVGPLGGHADLEVIDLRRWLLTGVGAQEQVCSPDRVALRRNETWHLFLWAPHHLDRALAMLTVAD